VCGGEDFDCLLLFDFLGVTAFSCSCSFFNRDKRRDRAVEATSANR